MKKPKNKYTPEMVAFVTELVDKKKFSVTAATKKMCEEFGLEYVEHVARKMREKMQAKGVTKNAKVIEHSEEFKAAKKRKHDKSKRRFIFTWCQNETDIHETFLTNIEAYAQFIDAEISVIAGRYKNPTSIGASKQLKKSEFWHKRVRPYLDANRHQIHKYLTVLSDVKTQPTATTPLSGFNGISGLGSCIIGHPRVHLKMVPTLEGYPHKMLLTTGAVSLPNYTDSKSGAKGAFHHSLGFVIVEIDGKDYHVRQVTADKKGCFHDLFYRVCDGEVERVDTCAGIVFGDIHLGETDKQALDTSFSLARKLRPEKIVLHDLYNGHSISHHEQRNPFILLGREKDGSWSLKKEVKYLKKWLRKYSEFSFVLTSGNHEDFLDRWLINSDWRKSMNKDEYLKYAAIKAKGKAPKGIIPYIIDKNFSDFVTTLGLDDSFRIMDFEVGSHGHIGANGSRPSPIQFKNLSTKIITAHSHTPHREDSHLCVGTLTKLRLDYNKGLSSWLHSNVIIHHNGKAQHVHIINGRYTTLEGE